MFNYAIMGAGGISNKFAEAVALLPDAQVIAVAARDLNRAEDFAQRHNIPQAYGDYEQMLISAKPDGVYIGVVTSKHFELTMLCIKHGIPVICEKSMFETSQQAKECFAYAAQQGVFVMEAMWSRFLPAIVDAKRQIEEGAIGKVYYIQGNIGWVCPKGDDNRFYSKALGGGAAYDLLVYPYEISTFLHPKKIVDEKITVIPSHTGVDATEQVTLTFEDGVIASIMATLECQTDESVTVCGDKGRIVIPNAHYAWENIRYELDRSKTHRFTDTETKNGFTYQAQHFIDCVKAGKLDSEVIPHETTIACAEMFDRIMEKIGWEH